MKKVEKLARNLLIRMREIDENQNGVDAPGEEEFKLLWDAIIDEINAICPDLNAPLLFQADDGA